MDERIRAMVVGSGGREDALCWKLSQSSSVDFIHVAPGNGGTESAYDNVFNFDILVDDFTGLVSHAKKHDINLVVIGPEALLVAGIQGYFYAAGIRCFGPSKLAARMEGSKTFAKEFMKRHQIPTAEYRSFNDINVARKYIDSIEHDIVIKASGLAAGKGVIIPASKDEAQQALTDIMLKKEFGSAGNEIVIERALRGDEISVLSFCDGWTILSLPPAQDHKRVFDGDQGPNTGGMGCFAPAPVSEEDMAEIQSIVQRTISAMRSERMRMTGILFTGFMLTESGPKVLEYNVRGGDPETQTVLPLLSSETDFAEVLIACTDGYLDAIELRIDPKSSATVVASSEGYPGAYAKNKVITVKKPPKDTFVFHAGTGYHGGQLVTTGGRVIASTSTAKTLEAAVERAYEGMAGIKFEGMHFRKDIAHRAFKGHLTKNRSKSGAPLTYASAGVSIDAGNSLVEKIKASVKSTSRPGADAVIGGFGGVFSLAQAGYDSKSPVLIGAIDGVGTKLKVAYMMGVHDTVGQDLCAMNVNDLVCQGAEPLFLLDCFSCSKLDVQVASSFVEGVAKGCRIAGCALIGGETAEMPGLFASTEYDVCGAAVGAVLNGKKILPDKESMLEGDILIGLGSSGLHSNGFSLVRKIVERKGLALTDTAPWDPETTVGQSLLTPTRIYVKALLKLLTRDLIKGMSHVTGGGLIENVPRMLPSHLSAELDLTMWKRPKVFEWMQEAGNLSSGECAKTFNNGVGMVLVVSGPASPDVIRELEAEGESVYKIGMLVQRTKDDAGCILRQLETWGTL